MKKTALAIGLCTATLLAAAQDTSPTVDTTRKRTPTTFKNNLLEEGKFSHSTSKGKVYILPYDNMPCLVPNTDQVARMPGSIQRAPQNRMPNAMPKRRLIPPSH